MMIFDPESCKLNVNREPSNPKQRERKVSPPPVETLPLKSILFENIIHPIVRFITQFI